MKNVDVAGLFSRVPLEAGKILGCYSGALLPGSIIGPYLSALSAEERVKTWTYDYEAPRLPSPLDVHTFHAATIRNVLGAINDYHGISEEPRVKKASVLLGGLLPLVFFLTAEPVPLVCRIA